jgi:regulatory protein
VRKIDRQSENFDRALSYSLLLLKYRLRSEREIIARLGQKGYSPKISKRVVERLRQYNLLNDAFFAQEFIQYAFEKGWGRRKIEFRLQKLGVSKDKSEKFLNKLDYKDKIKSIIENKMQEDGSSDPALYNRRRARLIRTLAGRGFEHSDIFGVLDSLK